MLLWYSVKRNYLDFFKIRRIRILQSMYIAGTGKMTSNPWKDYNSRAERILVDEGITNIMANAFEISILDQGWIERKKEYGTV